MKSFRGPKDHRALSLSPLAGLTAMILLSACLTPNTTNDVDVPTLASAQNLPGTPCPEHPDMLHINDSFCIDRFEASLVLGTGAAQNSADTLPKSALTWDEANDSCALSGKRLCSVEEWERACRGADGRVYPYGNVFDAQACNGFEHLFGNSPSTTGFDSDCVSPLGAFDLSGNLEEWTSSTVDLIEGSGQEDARAVRGGGFRANFEGLKCVGTSFKASPDEARDDRGFRCCL